MLLAPRPLVWFQLTGYIVSARFCAREVGMRQARLPNRSIRFARTASSIAGLPRASLRRPPVEWAPSCRLHSHKPLVDSGGHGERGKEAKACLLVRVCCSPA